LTFRTSAPTRPAYPVAANSSLPPFGGSEYQLTGITGFGGNNNIAITTLSNYAGADNILFYPTQPFVDFGGISFNTADGDPWNIYWNGYYGVLDFNTNPVGYPNSVTIDFSVTETPLPAALPLFGALWTTKKAEGGCYGSPLI